MQRPELDGTWTCERQGYRAMNRPCSVMDAVLIDLSLAAVPLG